MSLLRNVGIVIGCDTKQFDYITLIEAINKNGKYAWGTGIVALYNKVKFDKADQYCLGLLSIKKEDYINVGLKININLEFRDYLKHHRPKQKIKPEHMKYRFIDKEGERGSFIIIEEIFILKRPIKKGQIITVNSKNYYMKNYRSSVFIDLKASGIDANKEYNNKVDIELIANNPLINLLMRKEDDLVNSLVLVLKNNPELKMIFFKNLCKIRDFSKDSYIIQRRMAETFGLSSKNIPDIQVIWENKRMEKRVIIEAKLDSGIDMEQIDKYLEISKDLIVIVRNNNLKQVPPNVNLVLPWEDILRLLIDYSKKKKDDKLIEYLIEYMMYLGIYE